MTVIKFYDIFFLFIFCIPHRSLMLMSLSPSENSSVFQTRSRPVSSSGLKTEM